MATAAVFILLAALLPAVAASTARRWPATDDSLAITPNHTCGDMGTYAPGSAYEAALRHLVATISAKANAESCNSSNGFTNADMSGESPNIVVASAYCPWHPYAKSPDCGACIALAFREAQRLCPYQRQAEAVANGGECSVGFHDYDIMEFYAHGDPSNDIQGNTLDHVIGVVEENEENNTRMRWACRILETTIMKIFANLGWMSNTRRICA